MAKELMGWRKDGSKRWIKVDERINNGKQVVVSYRQLLKAYPALVTAATKEGTLAAANQFWEDQLAKHKTETAKLPPRFQQAVDVCRQMIDWTRKNEPDDNLRIKSIAHSEAQIEELEAKARRGEDYRSSDHPLAIYDRAVKDQWTERLRKIEVVPTDRMISGAIGDYLKHRLSDVGDRITPDSYDAIRCRLQLVKAFRDGDVKILDEDYVEEFWDSLKAAIKKKERSADYCQSVFTTFKMFVKYLWKKRRIDMPRNLDLYIDTPEKEIVVWEPKELKRYFAALNDRTKLYALLMLNCGAYDSDIADLKTSEVDWKQGRIIRKRSKSADEANAPKVNWKLWPETFRLLKKERANGELALLNQDGGPLRTATIGEDGKLRKSDNIRSAMARIARLLKIKKTPKQLRKTAATKLDDHHTYGRYVWHFLGHAPPAVGNKHYVTPSQDQMDSAMEWLGQQFGF